MTVVVAFAFGAVAALGLLALRRSVLGAPALVRENYRGVRVATAAGIVFVLVALGAAAVQSALNAADWILGSVAIEQLVVLTVVGFGLLGLWDDLLGATDTTGFRGHVRALARGHITTGMVKLVGGGLLALVVVADRSTGWMYLADAALVALAANLANLFDRRPGRVLKVALLAYIPLAVVGGVAPLGVAMAPIFGAALAMMPADLRERVMLGDTGANALGALLGVATVYLCPAPVRLAVLLVLIGANVLSEFVSYSKLIDRIGPLRWFDQLGRAQDSGGDDAER